MAPESTEYFRSRFIVERDLAKLATEPRIAAIHAQLAASYEAIVEFEQLRLTVTVEPPVATLNGPSAYWLSPAAYAPR